jgi:hypothetical protein
MQSWLSSIGVNCYVISEVSNNGGKYGRRRSTLNIEDKEGGNVELKIIVSQSLGDGVRSISEWMNLLMGPCKAFFLQVQPNFVSHLKLVWNFDCTWHWNYLKYPKSIGICVGSDQ